MWSFICNFWKGKDTYDKVGLSEEKLNQVETKFEDYFRAVTKKVPANVIQKNAQGLVQHVVSPQVKEQFLEDQLKKASHFNEGYTQDVEQGLKSDSRDVRSTEKYSFEKFLHDAKRENQFDPSGETGILCFSLPLFFWMLFTYGKNGLSCMGKTFFSLLGFFFACFAGQFLAGTFDSSDDKEAYHTASEGVAGFACGVSLLWFVLYLFGGCKNKESDKIKYCPCCFCACWENFLFANCRALGKFLNKKLCQTHNSLDISLTKNFSKLSKNMLKCSCCCSKDAEVEADAKPDAKADAKPDAKADVKADEPAKGDAEAGKPVEP